MMMERPSRSGTVLLQCDRIDGARDWLLDEKSRRSVRSTAVVSWWAQQDSNLQPKDYESSAPPLSYRPLKRSAILSQNAHGCQLDVCAVCEERLRWSDACGCARKTNFVIRGIFPCAKCEMPLEYSSTLERINVFGRLAQRESIAFTRRGSQVQIL